MSGVYIIGLEGTPYIKIGVSRDIVQRISDIETSTPYSVVLHVYERTEKATEIEAQLHKRLEKYRVRREWFDVAVEVAHRELQSFLAMATIDGLLDEPSEEDQPIIVLTDWK